VYFDRLKPKFQIGIGTLDEWYQQRYVNTNQRPAKRRRLNYTTDDIEIDLSQDEGEDQDHDDDQIELNKTVDGGGINKSLLYDGWIKDYKEEQKKNSKKRKRSSPTRSKSRSPTPVSQKNLQFDIS
jgi:hypothetical protein